MRALEGVAILMVAALPASARETTAPERCTVDTTADRRTTPSSDCMRCHDGSRASDARTGHRYDITYSPFQSLADLRPTPEQFDPRIVLVDRKVACMTCHDPASTLPDHLAAPVDGPPERRLCVACHMKD